MVKTMNRKTQTAIQLLLGVAVVVLLNLVANSRIGGRPLYGALDLTEERRYTLAPGTVDLLEQQTDIIFVRVLLKGEFPAGFKRLQEATQQPGVMALIGVEAVCQVLEGLYEATRSERYRVSPLLQQRRWAVRLVA